MARNIWTYVYVLGYTRKYCCVDVGLNWRWRDYDFGFLSFFIGIEWKASEIAGVICSFCGRGSRICVPSISCVFCLGGYDNCSSLCRFLCYSAGIRFSSGENLMGYEGFPVCIRRGSCTFLVCSRKRIWQELHGYGPIISVPEYCFTFRRYCRRFLAGRMLEPDGSRWKSMWFLQVPPGSARRNESPGYLPRPVESNQIIIMRR